MLNKINNIVRVITTALKKQRNSKAPFGIKGYMELEVRNEKGDIIHKDSGDNVILDRGKEEIIYLLRDNVWGLGGDREINAVVKSVSRLAIGDGGADPGTLLVPKTLDKTRTTLFFETWRQDISAMAHPTAYSLETVTDVLSGSLLTTYFNPANGGYYLNEAGLVISRPGFWATNVPEPGEVLLTHKTFKSFPFDPALNITTTFTWTIYIVL